MAKALPYIMSQVNAFNCKRLLCNVCCTEPYSPYDQTRIACSRVWDRKGLNPVVHLLRRAAKEPAVSPAQGACDVNMPS